MKRPGAGPLASPWPRVVALLVLVLGVLVPRLALAIDIQEVVTPGGIVVWLVEEHTVPIIAVDVVFRGGAALDPEGQEGLANMVSGLLDEGAGPYDSQTFQTRLDERAIHMGFSAGRDRLGASLATLSDQADEAFRLFGLALREARFDADAVARIRRQILAALARRAEDPNAIAGRAWFKSVYPDHPYGRPTSGSAETVAKLTVGDLRRFVSDRIAKDNMVIAVVGDIDAERLGTLLDRALEGLPDQAQPVAVPKAVAAAGGALTVIRRVLPQSVIIFGHDGLRRDDPDWYASLVLNYILGGGGFSSRLVAEVREKRGLAYSVSTGFSPFTEGGLFIGSAGTRNDRVAETVAVIKAEIARLRDGGVSDRELADAKTYLTGSYPLSFSSSGAIAGQLVGIQFAQLGLNYVSRRNSYIEAVSKQQIARVAQRLLHPERLRWVIVGDPKGLDEGAKAD